MQEKSQESENKLFEIAESKQGYFTSRQAKGSGYKDNTHRTFFNRTPLVEHPLLDLPSS